MIIPLAIVDLALEEAEIGFIAVLIVSSMLAGKYIRKLRNQLRKQNEQLQEQAEFNRKLNSTVDRMLKIDKAGDIDSNRRRPKANQDK